MGKTFAGKATLWPRVRRETTPVEVADIIARRLRLHHKPGGELANAPNLLEAWRSGAVNFT